MLASKSNFSSPTIASSCAILLAEYRSGKTFNCSVRRRFDGNELHGMRGVLPRQVRHTESTIQLHYLSQHGLCLGALGIVGISVRVHVIGGALRSRALRRAGSLCRRVLARRCQVLPYIQGNHSSSRRQCHTPRRIGHRRYAGHGVQEPLPPHGIGEAVRVPPSPGRQLGRASVIHEHSPIRRCGDKPLARNVGAQSSDWAARL